MDDYSFGAVVSFAGMFLLMAFDFSIGNNSTVNKNIAFLIPLMAMLVLGTYCTVKWMIVKRRIEKAS